MKARLGRARRPQGGRLASLGQDYDRGHREYVAQLEPGNALWLRTKPFSAPPSFELATCLRTFSHIVERLGLGVRAQVLDVGCGPGWLSEFLARCGYWVTGIDISEDMVEIARERVGAIGPVAEGLEAEAEFHAIHVRELPWTGRFDAAVLYDTMHHFDDELETLRIILGSLAPGGRIYIREGVRPVPGSPDERALVQEMEQYGTLESPFDPDYLRWCLEEVGFTDVRQFIEVDELLPLRDPAPPLRLLARWAWIRAGRRRPDTNTLIASKPAGGTSGAGDFAGRLTLAGPVQADGETVRFRVRVENTGRGFLPAPGGFPHPQGSVTVATFLVEGGQRVELPRALLPRGVAAGDTVEVDVAVPRQPLGGARELSIDLVREGIAWFSPPDAPLLRVPLDGD